VFEKSKLCHNHFQEGKKKKKTPICCESVTNPSFRKHNIYTWERNKAYNKI